MEVVLIDFFISDDHENELTDKETVLESQYNNDIEQVEDEQGEICMVYYQPMIYF